MNASSKQKSALSMLIVALMVLSTVLAVVISAAPTAAAAPVGGTAAAPVAAVPSGAPAAPTASGTITSELSTFAVDIAATAGPTVTDAVSGGTFGSGSPVYFYISSSNGCTGIPAGGPVGTYDLAGGATTLSDSHVVITPRAGTGSVATPAAGANYLVASDTTSASAGCAAGAQYTGGAAITTVGVATLTDAPTVSITGTGQPGTTVAITASNFDGGATVSVYFSNGDGTALNTQLLTSFTTTSGGSAPASASFTVPTVGLATYSIFAIETSPSTSSAASPFGGVSADTTITIAPIITVSPISFSGAASSALTISGEGFTAGDTIASAPGPAGSNDISIYSGAHLLTGTVHGAVTVSSTGTFTVSVTTVTAISIADSGAETVSITTGVGTYTFTAAVFVSVPNPTELGFVFTVTPTSLSSGSADTVGSAVTSYVYNFPADATVTIGFGPASFPAITTDANGYGALSSTAVIPAVSGGAYVPTATDPLAGLFAGASPVTVTPYFAVYDGSGNLLTSAFAEYFPGTGVYTVAGFGLTPGTTYAPSDTGAGTDAAIVAVIAGMADSAGTAVYPAVNGTAVFTYTPGYGVVTPPTTGASATISFSVATLGPTLSTLGYLKVGAVSITTPGAFAIYTSGGTETLAIGNLVPFGSQVYAGVSDSYNAYFGTTILSFGSPPSSTINAETSAPPGTTGCSVTAGAGACSLSYTVPTLSNGVYSVAITSAGGTVANALATQYVVVSTAGSSVTGGSLILVPTSTGSGYYAVGVGLDSAATVTLGWMKYTGLSTRSETLTNGAFADTTSLASILTTVEPAGNYQIFVEQSTASATGFISPPSTYTISAALTLTGNEPGTCTSATVPCGGIDSTASFTASGLVPFGYYDLYFDGAVATLSGTPVTQVEAGSSGSIVSTSFTVPTLMPGFYNVSLDISGTTTVAASATFEVAEGSSFTLTSGGADAASAFPGELVSFAWTPGTAPAAGAPVEVTVLLNGTAYTTEPAVVSGTTLMGSFLMPNSVPGTYFALTLEWTQTVVTVTGGNGGSTTTTYTSVGANFAQLVSGNGALLTGVTPGQIAEITTAVNQTLKVPIADLNAAVTSINGAVVKITTAFGNMTATLSSINATLTSVAGTVATIETSIGTITTSLSTISAQITSVNGVVTSMNGTLNVVAGNVVSIQTSLGTINGKVTSVINGIATVQTSLGNLSVAVSKIPTSPASASAVNTAVYLLYAAIALIVITLALAAVLLVRSGGRGGQGGHPAKAYEGPSSSSSTPPSSGGSGGGSTGGA